MKSVFRNQQQKRTQENKKQKVDPNSSLQGLQKGIKTQSNMIDKLAAQRINKSPKPANTAGPSSIRASLVSPSRQKTLT
jgi:hypothetical protein